MNVLYIIYTMVLLVAAINSSAYWIQYNQSNTRTHSGLLPTSGGAMSHMTPGRNPTQNESITYRMTWPIWLIEYPFPSPSAWTSTWRHRYAATYLQSLNIFVCHLPPFSTPYPAPPHCIVQNVHSIIIQNVAYVLLTILTPSENSSIIMQKTTRSYLMNTKKNTESSVINS